MIEGIVAVGLGVAVAVGVEVAAGGGVESLPQPAANAMTKSAPAVPAAIAQGRENRRIRLCSSPWFEREHWHTGFDFAIADGARPREDFVKESTAGLRPQGSKSFRSSGSQRPDV
jgi:hypothetical protein